MAEFTVKRRTYDTANPTHPSMQLKPGVLTGTSIATLNIARANSGQPTSGPIDKLSTSGSLVLSVAEFQAVWDAVFYASATNPVKLTVTWVDQADPRYADVISVVPQAQVAPHVLLQSMQLDLAALSTTATSINQRLAQDLSTGIAQLQKLNKFVRLGLLRLGVPGEELPPFAREDGEDEDFEAREPEARAHSYGPPPGDEVEVDLPKSA